MMFDAFNIIFGPSKYFEFECLQTKIGKNHTPPCKGALDRRVCGAPGRPVPPCARRQGFNASDTYLGLNGRIARPLKLLKG